MSEANWLSAFNSCKRKSTVIVHVKVWISVVINCETSLLSGGLFIYNLIIIPGSSL